MEIIESLRGHTSGFAVPTFVIDAPQGGGKVPIMPNYLLSQSADRVVVRNFEGFITTYTQPETYHRHNASTCPSCQQHRRATCSDDQEGIASLLAGEQVAIAPQGYESTHQRPTPIDWAPFQVALGADEVVSSNGRPRSR
jgi:lysine 2,3-aminomutase